MNLLKRLFTPKTEIRGEDISWTQLSTGGFPTYGNVSPQLAENLATVAACVSVISSSVASLPAWVYRSTGQGRKIVDGHPLARLIATGPNSHQTWPDFIEGLLSQVLLRGNAIAWVKTDQAGRVEQLQPIPWENVSLEQLPSGRLRYTCIMPGLGGHTGQRVTLLDSEVMHLRDRSDDGLVGRSRLSRAASVFRAGLSLQEHSESVWQNGATPSGVLKHDQPLSADAVAKLRTRFESVHKGSANAGRTLILDNGLQWQGLSFSPEDTELLESRKFSVIELARLWQVPPPLAGDFSHSSFTNAETASRWFSQFTLGPWIRKIETEFSRSVFGEGERDVSLEIDMSGLQRGDYKTRWEAHKIALETGALTRDEVRDLEGYAPGGQENVNSIA